MTDKYITSSQYREGLNSIKEYIDKSIPHIGYPVIFTLSADKVLEIYNSTNHEMEFDKPSSIDLNKEIIMTYNNEDIISENSLDNYIRYKNNNIAISFHIGYDINKNTNENKMVITIVELNTNITSDLILKQREDKYLNNKYLKKDVAIQNSITIGTRIISSIGQYSFSNGKETTASGDYSHAEGENTQAVNANCHAEGFYSCASGESSHAEGYWSSASGSYSHAEGIETTASGKYSHAEGNSTKASGESSHAEGNRTDASGVYSHAEGMNTEALGAGSHAEGWATTASSYYSHAEGYFTKASSKAQHVQGKYNIEDTKNKYAHIVGNGTDDTVRSNAHTLDWNGNAWFAGDVQANNIPHVISEKVVLTVPAASISAKKTEIINAAGNIVQIPVDGAVTYDPTKSYYAKYNNTQYHVIYVDGGFSIIGDDCKCAIMSISANNVILAVISLDVTNITDMQLIEKDIKKLDNMYIPNDLDVNNSITVGARNGTIGHFSSSFGLNCEASGDKSHAEGFATTASGKSSHAEGDVTIASGKNSHAEGENTTASGYGSHTEGFATTASADHSHAEGYNTTASGSGSHTEGTYTTASGRDSHAEGIYTKASSEYQHVQGRYNIEDTENKYAHIVGNGMNDATTNWKEVRSNAHTLDWAGNAWYAGDVQANNVPYVASEKVVLTVPAATITEKKTEIDKATQENPAQINITGNVAYDSTKSYYLKYNNKEYPSVYSTGMFYIAEDDCFCIIEFRNGSIVMEVVTLDTTNITDLQLIEKNIKKLDNKYVPNDLNVNNSITVGIRTGKIGEFSSSFGISCEASGDLSHAEGMFTTASGNYSHAEGETTTASGRSSHAECYNTTASGDYSHAEGMYTTALSDASHAEGSSTTASGFASHAEGDNTTASGDNSHVQGKYNIEDTENKYAHIVGNGSEDIRSNAHTLDWEGNAWFAGNVSIDGTPTNDKDLVNKKYVDDKISNIPDAYTLLYPKEVDRTIAYYDIYDLPLGDYRIAQQDGIRTWHICVYVNNIRTQLFSTQNSRGFSFSKRINGTGTADGKSGKLITIDTYSMTTGGETYTWMVYDDGSVDVKNHKATILSAYTNTEFTPTKDYQPATKKYVDDAKASIVVPNKTSELTNDSGFLTSIPEEYVTETKLTSKGYLTEHQSLDGYAKTEYVDSKTTLEETIFEGVASDTLNDYWTHCSLVDGEGCWVIDKEVIIGENIENPYYIEINGTDIYSPENSTYDATNKAWLYDHTMDNGKKLFICANYENQNKMVVPWDGMGNYDKLKIFTKTELGKKIEEQQQHSINKLATKEKPVFIGNISMGRKEGSTIGGYSVAIGYDITASGYASHAEGDNTVASGNQSHAEGERTTASGYNSHAEGYKTIASNTLSHAEGNSTTASGYASHAEGDNTVASGKQSHAEGNNTISSSENQHVQGKYNIEDKDNKYAHIVGNGSNNTRSNAHTLDWNGNAWFAGKVTQEGTPTDDKDLVNKKYVDDAKASIVVPTKTSELTNDSNFLTNIPDNYVTDEKLSSKGYLTEHQSLTKYATIEYVDSKLTTNYVSKEELTESTKPADTTTVKTTLNDILGGDYIE